MKQNMDNGKYILQNKLRTWTELMRERRAAEEDAINAGSPVPPRTRWTKRQNTQGDFPELCVPSSERGDHAVAGGPYAPGNKDAGNELAEYDQGRDGVPKVTFRQSTHHLPSSRGGRDGGSSRSGVNTPAEGSTDKSDYGLAKNAWTGTSTRSEGTHGGFARRPSRADALGDQKDPNNSDLDNVGDFAKQDEDERSVRASVF